MTDLQRPMFPLVWFDRCATATANELLARWNHKMGPITRPEEFGMWSHALVHDERPVAVTVTATLMRENVGGGLSQLTRANTVELARLCAERKHLCRVALRLWREFVFPQLGYPIAISYQDADLHSGDTYRFDGWKRVAFARGGSADPRSGRMGRNKWVWVWPDLPNAKEAAA
jgi:hypothetical protein